MGSSDDLLRPSIALFNRNRALIRQLYALRNCGRVPIGARDMQYVVKSSMVMDRADHTALLEKMIAGIAASDRRVRAEARSPDIIL